MTWKAEKYALIMFSPLELYDIKLICFSILIVRKKSNKKECYTIEYLSFVKIFYRRHQKETLLVLN